MRTEDRKRNLRLLLISIYILCILFSLISDVFAADAWYNSSWAYRKKITVQAGQVTSGPHTNFPMLVNFTSDAGLASYAQADGDDVLFTASDGDTKLDHEIESYTSGTGALVAWVEVTSIDNGTVIYMYYGNGSATNQQNISGTWDSNYKAVWHKNDLTASSIKDSTINANNGAKISANEPGEAEGQIGKGQSYDGSNDYVDTGNLGFYESNISWSFSTWINATAGTVFTEGYSGGFVPFLTIRPSDDMLNVASLDSFWSGGVGLTSISTVFDGTWKHIAVTDDNGSLKIYINGGLDNSTTYTKSGGFNNINRSCIGEFCRSGNNGFLNGQIDEVRLSTIARSAGWIATEYNNQNAPGSFYSQGSEENTFTWTGASSTDWNTAGNWDVNVVPGAGHTVVVPDVSGSSNRLPVLGSATAVTNLTINSGASLTAGGNSLTVSGTFSNDGTLYLTGDEATLSLTNDTNSGTVAYTAASGSRNIRNWTYYSLTISGPGGTFNLPGNITANNNLSVSAGILGISTYDLSVAGNSNVTGGTVTIGASSGNGWTTTDMTIGAGGVVTCSGNSKITVSGNWDSSAGTFNYGTSTVKMTGNNKTFSPRGFTRAWNLTIGDGVNPANVTMLGGNWANVAEKDLVLADNAGLTLTAGLGYLPTNGNLTLGTGATLNISGTLTRYIDDISSHISTSGTITGAGTFEYFAVAGSLAAPVTARTYACNLAVAGNLGAKGVLGGGASLNLGTKTLYLYDRDTNNDAYGILDNPGNVPVTAGALQVGATGGGNAPYLTGKLICHGAVYTFNNVTVYSSPTVSPTIDCLTGGESSAWNISGNVAIYGEYANKGLITAGASTWNVGGNFTNSGTFTAGASTVTLDGTNQSISGSTTFNNLTKTVTTARTLTFDASSTTTIIGTATLQGASGQLLSLRSSTPGTRWNFTLNAGAAKTISYVDVQDSDASGSDTALKPINPSNSSTSGNNLQWFTFQPDSMIKLTTEGDGDYLTDNIYETTVSAQAKSIGVVSGSTAAYALKFENDAIANDSLIITGTGNGAGFTVQYLDETATDRTAYVTGAGYTLSNLTSGANRVWTLNITPSGNPSPVPGGSSYEVLVTATSANDGAISDQVKAITSSTSANITLLKTADKVNANPGEEITYSVTATNGSGLTDASTIVLTDPIPSNTGFKIGGATFNAGTSTLTAAIDYKDSTDWGYAPVDGGCSAPSGYDYCITDVRWTMTGNMLTGSNFSIGLVVRIK